LQDEEDIAAIILIIRLILGISAKKLGKLKISTNLQIIEQGVKIG
jgi:hypothetical protein